MYLNQYERVTAGSIARGFDPRAVVKEVEVDGFAVYECFIYGSIGYIYLAVDGLWGVNLCTGLHTMQGWFEECVISISEPQGWVPTIPPDQMGDDPDLRVDLRFVSCL